MADVTVPIGAEDKDFVKVLKAIEKKYGDMTKVLIDLSKKTESQMKASNEAVAKGLGSISEGMKKFGQESNRANREATKGAEEHAGVLGRVSTGVKGLIGAYLGLNGVRMAWAALRGEMEAVIDRQNQAMRVQVGVAGSEQDVIRNLVGVSREERDTALTQLRGMAEKENLPIESIMAAAAEAISASGGDWKTALTAVEQATKFMKDRPSDLPIISRAVQAMSMITGSKDMAVNQGFIQAIGSLSYISDPYLQARNIPPALTGMVQNQTDPRLAAAIFSAQTVRGQEAKGEMTGTAMIQFTSQLKEFFTEGKGKRVGAQIEQDTGARIQALWADPKLLDKFLSVMSVESKAKAPLEEFLTRPQGEMATLVQKIWEQIPTEENARAMAETELSMRRLSPFEAVANVQRIGASAIQGEQLARPEIGLAAATREAVRAAIAEIAELPSVGAAPQRIAGRYLRDTSDLFNAEAPPERYVERLSSFAEELRAPQTARKPIITGQFGIGLNAPKEEVLQPTSEALRRADALEKLATELIAELRANTEATKANTPTATTQTPEASLPPQPRSRNAGVE